MFFNCQNEYCWSNLPYIKGKSSLLSRFLPRKPRIWLKDNNTWLNTNDIENVLFQYEKRFPEFKFLGVSPIDYDYQYYGNCVSEEICKLDIKKQFNDKKKYLLGIVFIRQTLNLIRWVLSLDLKRSHCMILWIEPNMK